MVAQPPGLQQLGKPCGGHTYGRLTSNGYRAHLKHPSSISKPSRRTQKQQQVPAASTGGGAYPPAGGNAGYGGGGRSDGDSGAGDGSKGPGKARTGLLNGWDERCAADPQFAYKVLIEQVIGVGAAVVGDMSSRPYWGLYELDFVFSTLIVGSIVNFSLMWLLASTGSGAAAGSQGIVQKLFSDQILRSWGAPTGHMFERGFPFAMRIVNLGYKGLLFALVGMGAGLMGTAVSNGLLILRQKLDPKFVPQNKTPNVLLNAATWATHMGLSSNIRYQMLNGVDMAVSPAVSPGLFKLITSLLRTGNNVLGGISFVTLAKLFGVQSSQGDAVKEVAKKQHHK